MLPPSERPLLPIPKRQHTEQNTDRLSTAPKRLRLTSPPDALDEEERMSEDSVTDEDDGDSGGDVSDVQYGHGFRVDGQRKRKNGRKNDTTYDNETHEEYKKRCKGLKGEDKQKAHRARHHLKKRKQEELDEQFVCNPRHKEVERQVQERAQLAQGITVLPRPLVKRKKKKNYVRKKPRAPRHEGLGYWREKVERLRAAEAELLAKKQQVPS
ncbi:hypothetical protein LTR10_007329 [Elasticomyces elasticus]|nr:hypothetical protein LTR10_007329 [Elasticomyces elasticus]KAK4979141.1 hypothetical protein LTR42_001643 [Elasticomyces elasticus]